MNTLYLLRHAKAARPLPAMRDFDRSLDATGRFDAASTGRTMREHGFAPALTLCSPARRTRETLEEVAASTPAGRVLFLDELYSADADGYLALIRSHPEQDPVLLVGHNPMMDEVTRLLVGTGDLTALHALRSGFPTSGLAVIRFETTLDKAAPGGGFLEAFLTPPRH